MAALLAGPAMAQVADEQKLSIEFPPESPVSVVSMDWGSSKTDARGGAMVVDLHTSLKLRNTSTRQIRGITLLVLAQEVTPGGKASVSVPSLSAGPGEVFPVRVDLRLLRPLQTGSGPLVTVSLDGVLFADLSFFGPNRLNSRRSMTVWELEARRDRAWFQRALKTGGPERLQEVALASLARQTNRPRIGVQVARRTTNIDPAHEYQLTFLDLPGAPVEGLGGSARMDARVAMAPRLSLANRGPKPVRHVEIGWLLKDMQGTEFEAGMIPAEIHLAPGETGEVASGRAFRFTRPLMVESMSGYIANVEYADGDVWVPSREALSSLELDRFASPSPEEQRLTNLYRKKGLQALIDELSRF